MAAVTILLGLGICVFLIWFFENIADDFAADDSSDSEYVYLRRGTESEYICRRRDTECEGDRRTTEYFDPRSEYMNENINNSENIIKKRTYAA